MTDKPSDEVRHKIPADAPILYADHVGDVLYGIHTSKIVFTVEQGIYRDGTANMENMRPVAVIAMPTALLLASALKIAQDLSSGPIVEETAVRYRTVLDQMQAIGRLIKAGNEAMTVDNATAQSNTEAPPASGQTGAKKRRRLRTQ